VREKVKYKGRVRKRENELGRIEREIERKIEREREREREKKKRDN